MLWDFDEPNLKLTNPSRGAEIRFAGAALDSASIRVGKTTVELVVTHRHTSYDDSYMRGAVDTEWWCLDFETGRYRDGATGRPLRADALDPAAGSDLVRACGEGLRAFNYLRPSVGHQQFVHLVGGWVAARWIPRSFRTLGFADWYPVDGEVMRFREQEALRAPSILPDSDGWDFEPEAGPRIVHAPTGDTIAFERPDGSGAAPRLLFNYQGRFGSFPLPIKAKFLSGKAHRATAWEIDCGTPFDVVAGAARSRNHPGRPGRARIAEGDWHRLQDILIDGLLRWPSVQATGSRPLWLVFDRSYHEGNWTGGPLVVGLDFAVTGLQR